MRLKNPVEDSRDAIRIGLVTDLIILLIAFGVSRSTSQYPSNPNLSTDLKPAAAGLGGGAFFGVLNRSNKKPTVVPTFRGDPANSHLDSATVPTPRPTPRNEIGAPRVNQPKSK